MGVATKPLRIKADDHQPLGLLAAVEGRSRSDIVHDALREYMERHRDRLTAAFREAQAAVAASDVEALTALFEKGAEERAREHAARIKALQG